jgi:methylglyoxal synthase
MKIRVLNTETQVEIREMDLNDWIDQTGECSLGRSPYSGLVLDSPDVSRLHAKFAFESGRYYFYDLGSSNGSMINGKVVDPQQKQLLNSGDIIRIGEFMLTLYPDEQSEMPATVIGGAEMTVCGQWSTAEAIDIQPLKTADLPEINQFELQLEQQLEQPEPEASLSQVEEMPLDTSPEAVSLNDSPSDQQIDHRFNSELGSELGSECDNLSSDHESPNLTAPVAASESSEFDFTVIQLESFADVSESISEAADPAHIESCEENSSAAVSESHPADSFSVEEPTLIQDDTIEAEVEHSATSPNFSAEETGEIGLLNSVEPLEPVEDAETKADLPEQNPKLLDAVSLELLTPLDAESEHLTEPDPSNESFSIQAEKLEQPEDEPKLEVQPISVLETLTTETLPKETLDDSSLNRFDNAAKGDENFEVDSINAENIITSDTHISSSTKHQPLSSGKYVALLAHDGQSTALAELVTTHKDVLSHYLTIATPNISEVLKQQAEFEVTDQTPAIPVGGFQTINSLITADKIAAVIFLRDFMSAQANQTNDEAFSRSCNIHQVLFASNFPTAEALMRYLQAVSKQ